MSICLDERSLPEGFERLEQYVSYWGCPTTQERWDRRAAADMADIRSFYDDMLRLAQPALDSLGSRPLSELTEKEGRLLCLLLSLASCSVAVELHRQPRAPYSPFPHGVRILQGSAPFG